MSQILVIDANIIFSMLFVKNSNTRKLFFYLKENWYIFYSPIYVLDEMYKYLKIICNKKGLDYYEVVSLFNNILMYIRLIDVEEYIVYMDRVKQEVNLIDSKDIDYVALAYKLRSPLWTNDKKLKKLKCIEVFSTEELMQKFENF